MAADFFVVLVLLQVVLMAYMSWQLGQIVKASRACLLELTTARWDARERPPSRSVEQHRKSFSALSGKAADTIQ
jgi:hypothetical protein